MNEKNQRRKKVERKGTPEELLRSYFADRVKEIEVPPLPTVQTEGEAGPGKAGTVHRTASGVKTGSAHGKGLTLARIAAALFLSLGCLNLYTGIGPKPLLSDEIARIYHEQDLKEKVETAFLSAHTFLNTYFYNRNTEGEKQ